MGFSAYNNKRKYDKFLYYYWKVRHILLKVIYVFFISLFRHEVKLAKAIIRLMFFTSYPEIHISSIWLNSCLFLIYDVNSKNLGISLACLKLIFPVDGLMLILTT